VVVNRRLSAIRPSRLRTLRGRYGLRSGSVVAEIRAMKLSRRTALVALFPVLLGATDPGSSSTVFRGLNLPPTQGVTRDGAFFTGQYSYEYDPAQVASLLGRAGFTAVRLAVNRETALNTTALLKHKAYIDSVGGRGIICMFDTSTVAGASWPRSGRLTGHLETSARAWANVHTVFASYSSNVMYEIFNEPWGYNADARAYLADMLSVIKLAGLPTERVILAGLYGSSDVQSVARAGWPGYLAYHCYSFWLPEGQRTRSRFAARIQQDIAGLSHRVFITEFGVGLDGLPEDVDAEDVRHDVRMHVDKSTATGDWLSERPTLAAPLHEACKRHPGSRWCKNLPPNALLAQDSPNLGADVVAQTGGSGATAAAAAPAAKIGQGISDSETMAFLGGLRDALEALNGRGVGIRGLFHWHGWHNGDTWDFWDAANAKSSRLIQLIMADLGEAAVSAGDDPFLAGDFVKDEQTVSMVRAHSLSPNPAAECPKECYAQFCQMGNEAEIGGKHLTQGRCTHVCSKHYNGMRYCGAGASYIGAGSIDCTSCARPLMCHGLPCLGSSMQLIDEAATTAQSQPKTVASLLSRRRVPTHSPGAFGNPAEV